MQHETLKDCIATLEKVKRAYSSRLDASVVLELDDVIAEVKRLHENKRGKVALGTLGYRTLQIISRIVSLISNLTDLMR